MVQKGGGLYNLFFCLGGGYVCFYFGLGGVIHLLLVEFYIIKMVCFSLFYWRFIPLSIYDVYPVVTVNMVCSTDIQSQRVYRQSCDIDGAENSLVTWSMYSHERIDSNVFPNFRLSLFVSPILCRKAAKPPLAGPMQ